MTSIQDITNDDAYDIALLVFNNNSSEDDIIQMDEIDCDIIPNDDGLLLDGDVLLFLDVSCRCFIGGIIFKDNGEVVFVDEENEPHPFDKNQVIIELENRGYDMSLFKTA